MTTVITAPLSQGVGYGVVTGLGVLFAVGMIGVSTILARRGSVVEDNDEFAVAKRDFGIGLTAAGVISGWTWSTTLLSSCVVAYRYGAAGSFFYAACNSSQVMVFSNLAIQTKRKVPNAHTFLEVIRVRYGTFVHLSFLLFSLSSNTLCVSSALIGGAAAIQAITGMSVYATLWLLPLSVASYTLRGGLRATILTDYTRTAVILTIILIFWFSTFASGKLIGSPSKMWELLQEAQIRNHDAPTYENSYLTIRSLEGLKFAILSLLEYTGVAFLDNSFHQKGIASDPASTVPGFLLGGLSWYAIPFTLATTMGLVALALENTPSFPTYPRRMNASEISAGLVLPYAAQTILGNGGAGAGEKHSSDFTFDFTSLALGTDFDLGLIVLLLMFMSITSALAAQLVGVSTVISHDVYRTYLNVNADDKALLRAAHCTVIGFAVWIAAFGSMLHAIKVDLNFLYNVVGIFTGPALPPLVATFFSRRQGTLAAGASLWGGFFSGVIVWITLTKKLYGVVNVETIGLVDPCLYGCATGVSVSAVVALVIALIRPGNYDWATLAAVHVVSETGDKVDITYEDPSYNPERLRKAARFSGYITLFLFVSLFLIWPLSMYGTAYVFSKKFFEGWVIVCLLWAIFAVCSVTLLPIFEGRHTLWALLRSPFSRNVPEAGANRSELNPSSDDEKIEMSALKA